MSNKIFYIEHSDINMKHFNFARNLFFKYKKIDIDLNRCLLKINRNVVSKKIYNRILKITENENFLFSNNIVCKNYVSPFLGKFLMKTMIINIIEKLESIVECDFRQCDVYVTTSREIDIEILYDLSKKFRSINIVTNCVKRMKRMGKKLEQNNIIYVISNNTKKSLKSARIIINMDCEENFFKEFHVNRSSIIINLSPDKLHMINSFQGSIIESIEIDFINRFNEVIDYDKYDKIKLYESFIIDQKYLDAKSQLLNDKCIIKSLVGSILNLDEKSLKNNFEKSIRRLDKNKKKV